MIHARNDYQQRIQDSAKKIPEDEPVFLLRGQDPFGGDLIRRWVMLNKRQLNKDIDEKKLNKDSDQAKSRRKAIALAEAHAFRMDDWPKKKASDV